MRSLRCKGHGPPDLKAWESSRRGLPILAFALAAGFASYVLPLRAGANEHSPEELRTKTEWISFIGGGGRGGFYSSMSLFRLRWSSFYWEILRGAALRDGGIIEVDGVAAWAGTGVGVPIHLDEGGRHEFRFGFGVGVGWAWGGWENDEGFYAQTDGDCYWLVPAVLSAEISYIWRFRDPLAIYFNLLGAQYGFEGEGPGSECDDDHREVMRGMFPAFNTSVGFII